MLYLFIIVVFFTAVLIDLRELKDIKKFKTGLVVYIFLLGSGFVISILLVLDKTPTSPAVIIRKMVEFILGS